MPNDRPRYTPSVMSGSASSLTADSVGNDGDYSQTVVMSLEQFISPIAIKRTHPASASTPGFRAPGQTNPTDDVEGGNAGFGNDDFVGPTIHELDPYFPQIWGDEGEKHMETVDYRIFNHDHDGATTTDFCEEKCNPDGDGAPQERDTINEVRITALRGPLIMSGWGFGVDDFPVPALGTEMPEKAIFDPDLRDMRSKWKTGPVHLMWDDERQVWAGGHRVVCGVLIDGAISAPTSICEPSTFKIRLLRNTGDFGETDAGALSDAFNEEITVTNRDVSLVQSFYENVIFVIAIKINYGWLPLWVGCADEDHCGCDGDAALPPCLEWIDCSDADGDNCAEPAEGDEDIKLPTKELD